MRETEAEMDDELEDEDGDDYIPAEPVEELEPPKGQKTVEKKNEEIKTAPVEKTLPPEPSSKEETKFLDEEANQNEAVEKKAAKPEPVEEKTQKHPRQAPLPRPPQKELRSLKIIKQESLGKGMRRIYAVVG